MFILGLLIGLVVGFFVGKSIKPTEQKAEESFADETDKDIPPDYDELKENKAIDHEWLNPDPNAEPNNLFYGKKIVFTGDLRTLSRDSAAMYVSKLGGDVNTSISRKTDIVVIGKNPGPSKMEKVAEINITRQSMITIMDEKEFLLVIKDHFDL